MTHSSVLALSFLCVWSVSFTLAILLPSLASRQFIPTTPDWVLVSLLLAVLITGFLGVVMAIYALVRHPSRSSAWVVLLGFLAVSAVLWRGSNTAVY